MTEKERLGWEQLHEQEKQLQETKNIVQQKYLQLFLQYFTESLQSYICFSDGRDFSAEEMLENATSVIAFKHIPSKLMEKVYCSIPWHYRYEQPLLFSFITNLNFVNEKYNFQPAVLYVIEENYHTSKITYTYSLLSDLLAQQQDLNEKVSAITTILSNKIKNM